MSKCYFVIGIDTEVGKTIASCALLQAVKATGYRTAGYKPVAPDSEKIPKGLHNSDALALQRNSSLQLDYATVNPYIFAESTSPHIISAQKGGPVEASVMSAGLRAFEQQADWVLVEGVGGWFTPLSDILAFTDWVTQEQLPVILVMGVRLGCINHAMLTAQIILHTGLTLTEWVANNVTPPGKRHVKYITMLTRMVPAPLSGEIPWLTENPENVATGKYISPALMQPSCAWLNCEQDRVSD